MADKDKDVNKFVQVVGKVTYSEAKNKDDPRTPFLPVDVLVNCGADPQNEPFTLQWFDELYKAIFQFAETGATTRDGNAPNPAMEVMKQKADMMVQYNNNEHATDKSDAWILQSVGWHSVGKTMIKLYGEWTAIEADPDCSEE